jgi:hypothetical protein
MFNPSKPDQRFPIQYEVKLVSGKFTLNSVMFSSINNLYQMTDKDPILISDVEFRYIDRPL